METDLMTVGKMLFEGVLCTSEFGIRRDKEFISKITESLLILSKGKSTVNIKHMEFLHILLTCIDYTKSTIHTVYLDGIDDKVALISRTIPKLYSTKNVLDINNHVAPIDRGSHYIFSWPEDEQISIPELLSSAYEYGLNLLAGSLPVEMDYFHIKDSVRLIAQCIVDIIDDDRKNIPINHRHLTNGLTSILDFKVLKEYPHGARSSLIMYMSDIKHSITYFIMYDDKSNVMVTKDAMTNKESNISGPFMSFGYKDETNDLVYRLIELLDDRGNEISFMDVVNEMINILKGE